jgi:thiol-disulfide isomerase/thioredoxin
MKYFNLGFSVLFFVLVSCKGKKETISSVNTKSNSKTETPVIKIDLVEGVNLGNKAPEINLPSPSGTSIALSSLKGKLVLIDFWASWCGPCRAENPAVVKAYNKFHTQNFKDSKGFEIYSVSLDQNEAAWKNAIEKDNLIWPYHVSDLLGWNNSAAKRYGINGIPYNFLIDGNGIIIAKNLRGEALEQALQGFVK